MLRKLILKITTIIRGEPLNIGYFSNMDLVRILTQRIINLIRGFLSITCRKFKRGWYFVGYNSSITGLEKIKLSKSLTVGRFVKISSVGSAGFSFGRNFAIKDYSVIDSFGSLKKESGSLTIGDNVGISEYCFLGIRGNLTIGNDVIVGPGVKVFTENHMMELNGIPFRLQDEKRMDVNIGNNVWIGSSTIILPGVTIGNDSVIAAGSVVVKDVEQGSVYAGVPAKFVKKINQIK